MKNILVFLIVITSFNLKAQEHKIKYDSIIAIKDLKKDLDEWFSWVHKTHPDLSHRIKDMDAFYKSYDSIKDDIKEPMSVLDFSRKISVLNQIFSDGHMAIGASSVEYFYDFLENGGVLFPFEVVFHKNNLLIKSDLGTTTPNKYSSYRITKINGVKIEIILEDLLMRIGGDSETQQKAILSRSFSRSFHYLYGEVKKFDIQYEANDHTNILNVYGVNKKPRYYKIDEDFNDNYKFEVIDKKNAVLTVGAFYWKNREQYFDFMKDAFKTLKEKEIEHLIIDIRENGGGDDEYWMDGILKYIANKPYKWGSEFKVKVLAEHRDEGEVIGSVKTGNLDKIIPVDKTTPFKFNGKVSILIGPFSYSSSILFANTVQDYGFGTLIGENTGGKSTQTGGLQIMVLKNSKLKVYSPRFILERPNGSKSDESVIPDKIINYSKINPTSLITEVLMK